MLVRITVNKVYKEINLQLFIKTLFSLYSHKHTKKIKTLKFILTKNQTYFMFGFL